MSGPFEWRLQDIERKADEAVRREAYRQARRRSARREAMMGIDDAIRHCDEKSKGVGCCAEEHAQLKKWLIELVDVRAKLAAVGEDAVRYRWLADYLVSDRTEYDDALVACADKSDMDAVIDAATPIKLA